jgi:hypothetical protein
MYLKADDLKIRVHAQHLRKQLSARGGSEIYFQILNAMPDAELVDLSKRWNEQKRQWLEEDGRYLAELGARKLNNLSQVIA